jgi:hypothetical protein
MASQKRGEEEEKSVSVSWACTRRIDFFFILKNYFDKSVNARI